MHPFAPADQSTGYKAMIDDLNKDLTIITGFAAVSAQPNSGAQGDSPPSSCLERSPAEPFLCTLCAFSPLNILSPCHAVL
jgi:hypothetical protein